MSNRTGTQKLARALQRVAGDALGKKPAYQACLAIVQNERLPLEKEPREVRAAKLLIAHRAALLASAERRAEWTAEDDA